MLLAPDDRYSCRLVVAIVVTSWLSASSEVAHIDSNSVLQYCLR